ncbi:MAG: hypothetical protein JW837_15315 [Sedimentisphaerales bacterium]|nr:hypothetical protein [Sedimentisphaerales bacterium]
MKIAAVVWNIVLLVIVLVMLFAEGLPSGIYLLVWLLVVGCPIVNLTALIGRKT